MAFSVISGVSQELTARADVSGNTVTETTDKAEEAAEEESEISDEMPAFEAWVEYSPQGWIVKGAFKDFSSDTIRVRPMCSTDGERYYDCGQEWSLQWLGSEEESELAKLREQRCLYDSEEPLKSYLAKDLNRFYIKLCIVRENGIVYETQEAVIERKPESDPAELDMAAKFAQSVRVREGRPPDIQYYGRYQITVREDASVDEIAALLPDALPVEVQIQKGLDYVGSDIVDCPVRWKSFVLSQLTAGESVTIPDAAQEIVIPADTVLNTQTGTYRINEPLYMEEDEVRLVLNVVAKDGQPSGALTEENYGLELAFNLKPTGASSIRAYTFMEGESGWTEISGLSLTDVVNAQPSTANSGYALLLGKEQEPYKSYWKAREAGEEPIPFFVGLKIEGGVYDGGQMVLAWPDTYELPVNLPEAGGSGGNEGNAGSDNRDDSTKEGQRPGLPQKAAKEAASEPPQKADDELPEKELPKERENESVSVVEAKIPENETLKDRTPGTDKELPARRTTGYAKHEVSDQISAEAVMEITEEMPDSPRNITTADENAEAPFGYEEISVWSDTEERSDRKAEGGSHWAVFAAATGIIAILTVMCIVFRVTIRRKMLMIAGRFFGRK